MTDDPVNPAEGLEKQIEEALSAPAPDAGDTAAALAFVGRLRAAVAMGTGVVDLAQVLLAHIEQTAMAACWGIRRVFPDEGDFSSFLMAHFEDANDQPLRFGRYTVTTAVARKLAAGWEVMRRNPSIRRLGNHGPHKAVLVGADVLRLSAGDVDGALNKLAEDIHELCALPQKKRVARLKDALATRRAAKEGHNPDDVARIQELEQERDAEKRRADELEAEKDENIPIVEDLAALRKALLVIVPAAMRLRAKIAAPGFKVPAGLYEDLMTITDSGAGHLNALTEVLAEKCPYTPREVEPTE